MGGLPYPAWHDREPAAFQVHDTTADRLGMAVYSAATVATPESQTFVDHINAVKAPFLSQARTSRAVAEGFLAERSLSLQGIRHAVSALTQTPVLPYERILLAGRLRQVPSINGGAPQELPVQYGYEPVFNYVHLDEDRLARQGTVELADAVACSVGQAALSNLVDVSADGGRCWYGTVWPDRQGRLHGRALQAAAVVKIAALTRQFLGYTDEAYDGDQDSLLRPYAGVRGRPYDTAVIMAAGLDVIDRAAGVRQPLGSGMYAALWAFAVMGRDEAARDEARAIWQFAAKDGPAPSYDMLEAQEADDAAAAVTLLERIEEACNVDASRRPSRAIKGVIPREAAR